MASRQAVRAAAVRPAFKIDARQQQTAQRGLAQERRAREKPNACAHSVRASSRRPSWNRTNARYRSTMAIHARFVLASEPLARLPEARQRTSGVAVVAARNRHVGQRLRRLVPHIETLERSQSALRQPRAFLAEVQLQIHLGLVEIAKALRDTGPPAYGSARAWRRRVPTRECIPAQIVKIRDVVVRLRHQQRHLVPRAPRVYPVVGVQRVIEGVHGNLASSHVAERDGDVLRAADIDQLRVGLAVQRQGFLETVEPVENVAMF